MYLGVLNYNSVVAWNAHGSETRDVFARRGYFGESRHALLVHWGPAIRWYPCRLPRMRGVQSYALRKTPVQRSDLTSASSSSRFSTSSPNPLRVESSGAVFPHFPSCWIPLSPAAAASSIPTAHAKRWARTKLREGFTSVSFHASNLQPTLPTLRYQALCIPYTVDFNVPGARSKQTQDDREFSQRPGNTTFRFHRLNHNSATPVPSGLQEPCLLLFPDFLCSRLPSRESRFKKLADTSKLVPQIFQANRPSGPSDRLFAATTLFRSQDLDGLLSEKPFFLYRQKHKAPACLTISDRTSLSVPSFENKVSFCWTIKAELGDIDVYCYPYRASTWYDWLPL